MTMSPQELYERHLAGIWRPRWWTRLLARWTPRRVRTIGFTVSPVDGSLRRVIVTVVDDDRQARQLVAAGDRIPGWKRCPQNDPQAF